jgi:enoyl-CoA hydratase/carnithine racemase
MDSLTTMTYAVTGRIARITLNRPERGNGITMDLPRELAECVERANLDPAVHVIALAGNGGGFCGGYDLVDSAEKMQIGEDHPSRPRGSPLDPRVQMQNHAPGEVWDPMTDYAMMSRNVKGFMSLFHSEKPVVCKVHGFCVAGGTDMALCSDLLVIADDAKIGYPPARVWGSPTTSIWFHRIGLEKSKRPTGEGMGPGDRIGAAGPARRTLRSPARTHRAHAGQPAGDDEAAAQPERDAAGSAHDADPRHRVRRHHPAHEGGLRLPAARRRSRLQAGRARAR